MVLFTTKRTVLTQCFSFISAIVLNVKTEVTQGRENSFESQIQVKAHHGVESKHQGLETASHMRP